MTLNHIKNGFAFSLALLTLAGVSVIPTSAVAGDSISIKVPVPPLPPIPKIKLRVPPPMVWLPTPQVYVARDTPHHIFYHENRYYLFENDYWYVGPGYEGPWAVVRVDLLPPGLRSYRARDWDDYQREAEHHHREHDDDDKYEHHAFYGHPREHSTYQRARWADWKRDNEGYGHRHDNDRDENRDEDRGRGRGHRHDD